MEATGNEPASSGQGIASPGVLHVLMMHGDDVIMSMLDKKLYICLHKVAMVDKWQNMLWIIKDKASVCDMVICEVVDMHDKVVQDIIKLIKAQVNIPVSLVSPDSDSTKVLNRSSGACPYTLKDHLQYVVEKKIAEVDLRSTRAQKGVDDVASRVDEITVSSEGVKKRNSDDEADMVCSNRPKRQRVIWTSELHQAFVNAVHKLGITNAVPKKILELMNMPELTRENVASHLQKYRLHQKKQENAAQVQQEGSGSRRKRKPICNPVPVESISVAANPFKLSAWSEPVHTSQLNFYGWDPSDLTFMEGSRLFNSMDDTQLGSYYAYDDNIDHLAGQAFGWDLQAALPPGSYENQGSYGGELGLHYPYSPRSINYLRGDGFAAGLIDGSIINQGLLIESNQLHSQIAYTVPRGFMSSKNNAYNILQHQNSNASALRSYSNTQNIEQGRRESYTAPFNLSSHISGGI